MRINNVMFCFAHLQSCHNGWASNISIVVDTGCTGIHHTKHPIVYSLMGDLKKNGTESGHSVRNFKFVLQVNFMCYFEVSMFKFVEQWRGQSENIYLFFYGRFTVAYTQFLKKNHTKLVCFLGIYNNGYQHYYDIPRYNLIWLYTEKAFEVYLYRQKWKNFIFLMKNTCFSSWWRAKVFISKICNNKITV